MVSIVLIPGDGIGPQVTDVAKEVMDATGVKITWHREEAGQAVFDQTGTLVPDSLYQAIERHQLVLKGPLTTPIASGFRSINVALRQKYDLYANMRPIKTYNPLAGERKIDLVIFRENTEDLYMGLEKKISNDEVHAIKVITRKCSTRIAKAAFDYARANKRKRVSAVHKANIMKLSDGLFLEACRDVAIHYPEITYDEVIVDNMCMQLVMHPERYDILLTENLYGDILSDLAAGLVGGLGLVPGANCGKDLAIFEAVHGSAPDIAGTGMVNPIAMVLSGAMLFDHIGETSAAQKIRDAVSWVMRSPHILTPDLHGSGTTLTLKDALISRIKALRLEDYDELTT